MSRQDDGKYRVRPRDTDDIAAQWIDDAEQSFIATGNPCFVVDAFSVSIEAHWYPPDWVLDFLAENFQEFSMKNYQPNLNTLLGFSRGRGRDNAYTTQIIAERDEYIMGEIFDLRRYTGISIKDAAEAIAAYFAKMKLPYPYDDVTKTPLKAPTLESRYKKEKWEQHFETIGPQPVRLSPTELARYLAAFGVTKQPDDHAVDPAIDAFFRNPPPR